MTLVEEFVRVFDVWEEARPYLPLMVDEQEMQLVVAAQDRAITVEEAASLLGIPPGQAAILWQLVRG